MTPTCPRCGSPIDPLRARAVRIVNGRITAFCSPVCRDAFAVAAAASGQAELVVTVGAAGVEPEETDAAASADLVVAPRAAATAFAPSGRAPVARPPAVAAVLPAEAAAAPAGRGSLAFWALLLGGLAAL
ncbi:MAG TPA: hypothetical protein VGQ83_30190, partial [Polyangia bacterium]